MQPPSRRVPVEAGAPPNCQRTCGLIETDPRGASFLYPKFTLTLDMDQREIEAVVRRALDEDLPDITSESIFDRSERGRAWFLVKERGVIAGLVLAEATFRAIEPDATGS